MTDELLKPLLEMGLPGIIIAGLVYAYWTERKEHNATRDKRVQDLQSILESQNAITASMTALTDAVKDMLAERRRSGGR